MAPSPLLPYHVQLILQYITPPSELVDPVPSHILSRALLQRHVFLELQPADAPAYLSWDLSSRDRVISLLESIRRPLDDLGSPLPVAYVAGGENTFAHVHLRSVGADGLRLVFEWEESDRSWKYHDAGLMPFPLAAHSTLDAALSSISASDAASSQFTGDGDGEDEDDNYWNSYGGADENEEENSNRRAGGRDEELSDDEDAYWAQYASVQGTADSTIPTPPHARAPRRLVPAPEEPLPIPHATMIRPRAGPRDPPSPTTLALRLDELDLDLGHRPWAIRSVSAPRSPPDYAFDDMVSQHRSTGTTEEGDSQDDDSAGRSLLGLSSNERTPSSSCSSESDGSEPPKPVTIEPLLDGQMAKTGIAAVGGRNELASAARISPEDDSVREVIRGAYRLWRAVHVSAGTSAQQDFLQLVSGAIEGL